MNTHNGLNYGLTFLRENMNPMNEFSRDFDRLFDDWLTPASRVQRVDSYFVPACDVDEQEDHYLLTLEMAGVKKDDIKMEVIGNQVIVSGERRNESRTQETGKSYSERRYGKFQRAFGLPAGVDTTQLEANYQDGILRVVIPKAETAKPRQIKITNGSVGSKFFGKFLGAQQPKKTDEKDDSHSSVATDRAAS